MARIVIATTGSLGDLHPFLALGAHLATQGHEIAIATAPQYRARIRREDLQWRRMRPEIEAALPEEKARRLVDRHYGLDNTLDELILPVLADSAQDLLEAAAGADLLVGSSLAFATGPVAERLGIPYATACLQPMMLYSARDPWVPAASPWLRALHPLGRVLGAPLRARLRRKLDPGLAAIARLRREWELPEVSTTRDVLPASPHLHLALFSSVLGAPQRDWPARTVQTGFAFHDGEIATYPTAPGLLRFLTDGEAPVVFTLGSSAVHVAGDFYEQAAQAAATFGRRALLLTGPARPPATLPPGVAHFPYAPYGLVFPRAAAIVHQGGVGTTAQALRAGKPMVVVPFAFDQEDNAARILRLGVGYRIARDRCSAPAMVRALARLLGDAAVADRAASLARRIAAEDGAAAAARALEGLIAGSAARDAGQPR